MRNPSIAIECGACRVPINAVINPEPSTMISCPKCEASDTFAEVRRICFEDVAARFRRAINPHADQPAVKWKFKG